MTPAYFRNVSGLLLAFVVLSALAHGVSLLLSPEPVIQLSERRFGTTLISTVLSPAKNQPAAQASQKAAPLPQAKSSATEISQFAQSTETTKQSPASSTSVISKTEFKISPATAPETPAETRTETLRPNRAPEIPQPDEPIITTKTLVNDIVPLTTEQLASQREKQRNYLLGEFQSRLNRYLSYPLLARKRGWQGEVMVAFYVDAHGRLHNIRLTQSSGHPILDHSAITAIGKLRTVSLPDRLGQLQAMEMQLPVIYQLRES